MYFLHHKKGRRSMPACRTPRDHSAGRHVDGRMKPVALAAIAIRRRLRLVFTTSPQGPNRSEHDEDRRRTSKDAKGRYYV